MRPFAVSVRGHLRSCGFFADRPRTLPAGVSGTHSTPASSTWCFLMKNDRTTPACSLDCSSRRWIPSGSFWRKTASSPPIIGPKGPYASAYSGANGAMELKARKETDGSNASFLSNRPADPVPYLRSQNSSRPSILISKNSFPTSLGSVNKHRGTYPVNAYLKFSE